MPEFLTLLPPDSAREKWLAEISPLNEASVVEAASATGRVTAEDVTAPHPLPAFPRSTVDGYAVRARDTFGASDTLPGYLTLIGEVPMGAAPAFEIQPGQCALIHTGGMIPPGADAALMLEYTQPVGVEIEVLKSVADGENILRVGEDVAAGQVVLPRGVRLRPAEIGGLMALGIQRVNVVRAPRVGLLSSGDEVIPPVQTPLPGQVRDINAYTLAALVSKTGGEPIQYGIIGDDFAALQSAAARALAECDVLIITAGSSASTRDMTADVIKTLGAPGVLVHGLNTRPGKPTILGVCGGKAVIGLPGNPVSALVNGYMMVVPLLEKLLGLPSGRPRPTVRARLTVNLASQAGREDWQPVRLLPAEAGESWLAEPVFGKSNLIFSLAAADGLLKIPPDVTGLAAGASVEVLLM
ncbi:MAG: molybdopterin molybdenumtransferase MoeA [Anaerolineae bacterium CG_4_9_14_3_um_filter_57_17]|nr:molybdopterin molybdotransferase MoeA [bacterium]NCT19791.1 molybdopterin molybdotransferase MoeA [bacterium]OIO85497.1 MAG: molybdopterin molybdenumtransferase MoeA [Anaerolineae bacterium CG2_30_57_67]PJB65692.1 MAG: molybdopterin molybdenumtransferase MoeA [Anaerolineae bacterium CG_4_9_14_3_um_filter_57_17]